MEAKGAINQYEVYVRRDIRVEGGKILPPLPRRGPSVFAPKFTINLAAGTTPFVVGFDGIEYASNCYRLSVTPVVVTHVWYRPAREEIEELHPASQEHVLSGGLLLAPPRDQDGHRHRSGAARLDVREVPGVLPGTLRPPQDGRHHQRSFVMSEQTKPKTGGRAAIPTESERNGNAAPPPAAAPAEAAGEPKKRRVTNPVLRVADQIDALLLDITVDQAVRVMRWVNENHEERVQNAKKGNPQPQPDPRKPE